MLMRLQELCKSCMASCYCILFYYGAKWQNYCTILVQEFHFILFYCKWANRLNIVGFPERREPNRIETSSHSWCTILRSSSGSYQLMLWNNDNLPRCILAPRGGYGSKIDVSDWATVTTAQLPALTTILRLAKCGCTKTKRPSSRCDSQKAGLRCTDWCGCSDADYQCVNHADEHVIASDFNDNSLVVTEADHNDENDDDDA